MPRTPRRRIRIVGSLLFGLTLIGVQATAAMAWTYPATAVKDGGCFQWGSQWANPMMMLTIGNYHNDYNWNDFDAQLWTNACGPAAPYGPYKISSKKQITAKFWVTKSDVDSCTGGAWPPALSCTTGNNTTTVTFQTAATTSTNTKRLIIDDVWFASTPGGGHAYMTVTGKTVLNGTELYQVWNPPAFQ